MREHFIKKFIIGIFEFIDELGEGLSRIPYKGFRYSDFNNYGYSSTQTYKGLKNLEHRRLIKNIGNDTFRFTDRGVIWLERAGLKYFKNRYPKWDKKWRLVIFDIPREFNRKRDSLRGRLKYMGFFMLQRSVFVFPYPCKEELSDICEKLKISNYVDMVVAESVGSRETELLSLFKL